MSLVDCSHVAPLGLNAAMHRNLRHCIYRRGEVSSLDGLGNPTPTGLTVRYGITCRSSGALRCLVHAACYKHIAPLGVNAAMHRNSRHCIHRGGEVSLPSGLGNPTPTDPTLLAHVPIFVPPVFRLTCRPSGAKCGNAPKFKTLHLSSGRGLLVQRVGGPNPYGFNRVLRYHMSLLWGFVVFCVCRVL